VIRASAFSSAIAVLAIVAAGCGGGGDNDGGGTPNASGTSTTASRTATGTGTPDGTSVDPSGSPVRGTAGVPTPAGAGNTPVTGGGGGATPGAVATPNAFEATFAAEAGGDIAGGDPSQPRQPVGSVPTPPPGAAVDPPAIAPPNPSATGLQMLLDLDASTPGIQTSRTVSVGDVFRVAVVVTNVPPEGVSAFNFFLNYDKTKVVAPTYTGGSSNDRNPDLNNDALGEGWTCLPAPEGDTDDPGGISGDGNPATGQALLSCFLLDSAPSGTLVLATVEFHAIASGSVPMTINGVALAGGPTINTFGRCEADADTGPAIPCTGATVTVK
jgi:hypothetical protein